MDFKKVLLYLATAVVGTMIWSQWMKDYPANKVIAPPQAATAGQSAASYTPSSSFTPKSSVPPSKGPQGSSVKQHLLLSTNKRQVIHINTDVLSMDINLAGGNIVKASLPRYPVSLKEKTTPITILNNQSPSIYMLQSGLTDQPHLISYRSSRKSYQLNPSNKNLKVTLTARVNDLLLTKTYTFTRGDYAISLSQNVKNVGPKPWGGSFYQQILRQQPQSVSHFSSYSYNGAAISSPEVPYHKLSYKDMSKQNVAQTIRNGWVAMQQHYFLSALVPQAGTTNHYYSHVAPEGMQPEVYALGYMSQPVSLAKGQQASQVSTLYVGPEKGQRLAQIAHGLDLTIDYGWLSPISVLIFWLMRHINVLVANWGWTIILITVLIKIALYWPSAISYRSMGKMRDLAPKMELLKQRFGEDRQAMSKATMALYKKEKVNPMGGCLPMLVQIPIFIALYHVLGESVQLRQAPFIFWIHDLSIKDPFYVLPILMGASMFLQQKLSPQAADPTQAKMFMFLPAVMTIFFLHFPAGLVLYWLTNNLISILQQWYIMNIASKKIKPGSSKRKKRKR